MKLDYNTFTEKFENNIWNALEEEIRVLDIPKEVKASVIEALEDNFGEVLKYRYEQYTSEYEDRAYDTFKDDRCMRGAE